MKKQMRRYISLALAFLILLQLPGVGLTVRATETDQEAEISAQAADTLEAAVEKQIRAFADSIDQSNADDTAAKALAKQGLTGGGKKLSVGKSHALTATLMNSEMAQITLSRACASAIEFMQKCDLEEIPYIFGGCNWYDGNSSCHLRVYPLDQPDYQFMIWDLFTQSPYTGAWNDYDRSLEWIAASTTCEMNIKRVRTTADTVVYQVNTTFKDRFDFSTSSNSGFKNLISGLGAVFFKEFDWEAAASFELTVPNPCTHSSGMYRWTYDAANRQMISDTTDGYTENQATQCVRTQDNGVKLYYFELEQPVRLRHDESWVLEYDARDPEYCLLSPLLKRSNMFPSLLHAQNNLVSAWAHEKVVLSEEIMEEYGLTYYLNNVRHYYGTKLSEKYPYDSAKTYTYRLENKVSEDGSNMVYLTVVDTQTGETLLEPVAMDDYYRYEEWKSNSELQTETSGWFNGQDLLINYIGSFELTFEAEYYDLRIWENGIDGGNGDYFVDQVTEPMCTQSGYTDRTCSLCGYNYREENHAALGHELESHPAKDPTCVKDGWEAYETCSRCDYTTYRSVAAPGHSFDDEIVHPTCTKDGYTSRKCSVCDMESIVNNVEALGHNEVTLEAVAPTCTTGGLTEGSWCSVCGQVLVYQEKLEMLGHSYKSSVTAPTCTAGGYTTYTCHCGESYVSARVDALGHEFGEWELAAEANPAQSGEERRTCTRCDHFESRSVAYVGNALKLEGEELTKQKEVWIDGMPYPVITAGDGKYVELPNEQDCILVTYTYQNADNPDIHTQYPTGMKIYKVSGGKITHIKELDDLLRYSGSSIRITGKKGIRMITSLTKENKAALTGSGLAGYKLVEYGTALCWAKEIQEGDALTLGKSFTRSNYAYKKGVADPIFATTKDLVQYTNVLVGFTNDQCKDDIAMRPYIILEDANGEKITLYGGTVYRSIGYIAYQNRNVVKTGTEAYKYVWDIIHYVYGSQYDADYKG